MTLYDINALCVSYPCDLTLMLNLYYLMIFKLVMENLDKKTISEIIREISYFHGKAVYSKSIAEYTGKEMQIVSDQYLHVCALLDELSTRLNVPTLDQQSKIYAGQ